MAYRTGDRSLPARRVAVTGAGIVTSHGAGWRANAVAFREGRRSLRPVTLFDVSRQRVQCAGQADVPETRDCRMDRGGRMLAMAMNEALGQAEWRRGTPVPVVLGTSAGGMRFGEDFYRQCMTAPVRRRGQAVRAVAYQSRTQADLAMREAGIPGPVVIVSNACASGANAIGHAFEMVRRGRAGRVLCGGWDALCQLVFAGFDSLKALSPGVPRPFDARRDGLALGEGAAALTLEAWDDAVARGADIVAEITGYGMATDLHHLTQPQPEGLAAEASMRAACRMAGIGPGEVDYINAHGTGTPLNDSAEGAAISRWAGADAARVAVSSTKGAIGHLLGGAGAVEAVICLMVLRERFLPPNTGGEDPDPVCGFDLVQSPRETNPRHVLTNSFGFGGSNASLVFRRADF